MSFSYNQFDIQHDHNIVKFLNFCMKYKFSEVGRYYYNNNLVEWSKKLLIQVLITFVSELLSVLFASISTSAQNLSKLFAASYYYKNIIRFYC